MFVSTIIPSEQKLFVMDVSQSLRGIHVRFYNTTYQSLVALFFMSQSLRGGKDKVTLFRNHIVTWLRSGYDSQK